MTRSILDESTIHPAIRQTISDHQAAIVREVQAAVSGNKVVVVGMKQNPYPKKACKALNAIGAPHRYLEYGNYFSQWKPRTALKMWTGWSTFPMVFINGTLIGGASELQKLIDSGEFTRLLSGG